VLSLARKWGQPRHLSADPGQHRARSGE